MTYRLSTPAEVQKIFNEHGYWERAQKGELTECELWRGTRKRRKGDLRGTVSQTIGYFDHGGKLIARVHQNISVRTGMVKGRPDPITLLHDGVLYDCGRFHR